MDRAQRYMAAAIVCSLAVHAAPIFGIRFVLPDPKKLLSGQPLEVVLVNMRTDTAPTKADVDAQANLDGGGNTDAENRRVKSPLPAKNTQPVNEIEQVKAKQQQLEAEARQLVAQMAKNAPLVASDEQREQTEAQQGLDPEDIRRQARELTSTAAQLSKRWEQYQTRPRKTFIGARAKEYRFARYVEDWRDKVQRTGNAAYPVDKYGQKLYGRLLITVELNGRGEITNAEITSSSGKPDLDAQALRILYRSSPFGPFPPEIAKDTDILVISRTWTFGKGDSVIGDE
ncbi:energy transducer TonB family protein [Chitinibacteraceae bacterium HSL-7]